MTQDPEVRVTAADLVARARELTTLPDIYVRVKKTLVDPASSHSDVADVLSTDPALSARLLRMANSAFYGRPGTIATVSRAVGLLGTQQIHDLVLATAVIHAFDGFSSDLLDRRVFWRSSLFGASAAKLLADQCGILDSERLFVGGLLAPVGTLILYQELPEQMRSILADARTLGSDVASLQRGRLGFDYARLSAELFTSWQLPPELVMPIRGHTRPSAAQDTQLEAGILYIATQLAAARADGKSLNELVPKLNNDAWDITELTIAKLEEIDQEAQALTEEIAPVLLNASA
ncbi:MAG: HDOD domain-containing protein [Sedimenticolaceae bacterium]